MDKEFEKQVVSIIDKINDMTIATVQEDGFPQATTVSYMNDGLTIYFGTSADSQKAKNIELKDKISLTINCPYKTWDEITGLSIGGRAKKVTDPKEFEDVCGLMFKKFPQIPEYADATGDIELAVFRINPIVISLLDYSKGFGHCEIVAV